MDGYVFYTRYELRIVKMINSLCARATCKQQELAETLYDCTIDNLPRIAANYDPVAYPGVKESTYILNTLRMYLVKRRERWWKLLIHESIENVEVECKEDSNPADKEQVYSILSKLDGVDARLLRLYYLESKTHSEIAKVLGVSRSTITNWLATAQHRARKLANEPQRM